MSNTQISLKGCSELSPPSLFKYISRVMGQEPLYKVAYANSKCSSEPALKCRLARTFALRSRLAVGQGQTKNKTEPRYRFEHAHGKIDPTGRPKSTFLAKQFIYIRLTYFHGYAHHISANSIPYSKIQKLVITLQKGELSI